MANTKSAVKRIRTSQEARLRNKAMRSRVKTAIKRYENALQQGDADERRARLQEAASVLDKAAAKGALHRNAAARHKARLTRRLAQEA